MKLTDPEIVIIKAMNRLKRPGGLVPIADIIRSVNYRGFQVKKILLQLAEKGVIALSRHDFAHSLKPAERKLMIALPGGRRRIGGGTDYQYFHAAAVRDPDALPKETLNPMKKRNPGRQHLAGGTRKQQRAYEEILRSMKASGRYKGRQKEAAARIARAKVNPPRLAPAVKTILRAYMQDGESWEYVRGRLVEEGFTDKQLSAAQDFWAIEQATKKVLQQVPSTRPAPAAGGSSPTQAIVDGMIKVDPAARQGALIPVEELRDLLKSRFKTKRAFDDAVLSAADAGAIVLHRHVDPYNLSDRDRDQLVYSPQHDVYFVGAAFRNPMRRAKKNKTIIRAKRVIALTNRGRRRRNPDLPDTIPELKKLHSKVAKQIAAFEKTSSELARAMAKEGNSQLALSGAALAASQARFREMRNESNRISALKKEQFDLEGQILNKVNRLKEAAKKAPKTNPRGRRPAGNPLDRGTRGWILVFIREQVRDHRSWADSKKLLEASGFDADVIKAAESMYRAEAGGKGSAKTKKRMGMNPRRRLNADGGHLQSEKAQLAGVVRSIKTLKTRISKAKDPYLKSGLRALMIEMQGTREDLKRAIRQGRPRRNSEKRDSDHPIEVTRHWRAGPPGYLTPWQRAHAAGQGQLFDTGIKPATRRHNGAGKRKARKNGPTGKLKSLFKSFSGKNPRREVNVKAPKNAPAKVTKLGRLRKIKIKGGRWHTFDGPAAPYLAADSRHKLHVVGGKYRMNPPNTDMGEIDKIVYDCAKPHLKQPTMAPYIHTFGEEGGSRPRLKIDGEGLMHITGGSYTIETEGIRD